MVAKFIKLKQRTNKPSKTHSKKKHLRANQHQVMVGPPRVKPGRLSVSRTFGDIEAKVPVYGGNPKVVIAIPEITEFTFPSSKPNNNDDQEVISNTDKITVSPPSSEKEKAQVK